MYHFLKRLMDFVLASLVVLMLSFPLLLVMFILRFTGEGKVFYRQKRIGLNNKNFGVWKFVTMRSDSEKTGTITVQGDSRILPVGKVLRDTKINEIPQLINIITGDMSIVGPRPLTQEAFDLYPDEYKPYVYQSKPGLTGIGSVVFRDEERILAESGKDRKQCYREDIMPIKGAVELWYYNHRSLWVDCSIIFLTAVAVLLPGNELYKKWFPDLPKFEIKRTKASAPEETVEAVK